MSPWRLRRLRDQAPRDRRAQPRSASTSMKQMTLEQHRQGGASTPSCQSRSNSPIQEGSHEYI